MMSVRRILAILRKELLQLRRDRLTFGMVIMIPLIQLVLFGYAINTNVRHIPAAVVDQSDTGLSRALIQIVGATQVVDFTQRFATVQEAETAIIRSDVRAALIIPKDLAQRVARNPAVVGTLQSEPDRPIGRPVAQWLVDGSDTVIAASVKSLRNMPLAELFRRPANAGTPTFEVALYYNPEQRSAVNIVPGLVGIILTMTMIMFTSAAIVRETERGNMEMLINTPVKPVELMIGKIIPYIAIGFVQTAIILGLGYLVFDVPINGSFAALFLVILLFILASLSLGLVISTIAKNQLQAMQMTIFVLLPSILLSGFMFPYEGMPKAAQYIADASLAEIDTDSLWLLGFTVVGMTVASIRFRKSLD